METQYTLGKEIVLCKEEIKSSGKATSPVIDNIREKIGNIAAQAISKLGYVGAGTIEFLYQNGEFYFLK